MAELLKDAEWLRTVCPACKKPLALGEVMTVSGHRYIVWCPRPDCDEMADGPNEGGYGKSPEKALKVLMAKLGISKDYEIESPEPSDEPAEETKSEKPAKEKKEKKAKGGKRGRKPAPDNSGDWIIPVGEFTMKEFCEKNETYPYKALPFFKSKGVEECGTKKTSTGRGKPAVLYKVKI